MLMLADVGVLVRPSEAATAARILGTPQLLAGVPRVVAGQVVELPAVDAVLLDVGADVVEEPRDAGEDAGGGPGQDGPGGIALELIRRRGVFVGHVEVAAGAQQHQACQRRT